MENSSYLEDLTGLLAKVASCIDNEKSYLFGEEYYLEGLENEHNSSFKEFVNKFKNTFFYGSCEKINIIRGRAGIGKSLFFTNGVLRLIRNDKNSKERYIYMGVDFKNIDNDMDIRFYEELIYQTILVNAIDCIRNLGDEIYNEFDNKYECWKKYVTPRTYLFPLKFFCEKIYLKYGIPCVITFDNIDLASVKTQNNVFDATVVICDKFNRFMRDYASPDCYRLYFVMRPETELRYNEGNVGEVINFPLPNILNMSLAIIKKVLIEVAEQFDNEKELSGSLTCSNVLGNKDEDMITFKKFMDVAQYFYRILDHYLGDIWNKNSIMVDRLGTSEEFHCNIVNYNVRTFLRFLSDTISNGGFKPLTKEFNEKLGVKNYNTYDYIEMIIRGRWFVHPGNKHINGEGGNKAPIVYNIFETYGNNQETKVEHFMLNIRILQYFFLRGDNYKIFYSDMKRIFSQFFDEKYICEATQRLVYVRFLYSYEYGDNQIASLRRWQDIKLSNITELELSPVGRFYLEKMICEFEYLYQMSLTSLMENVYVEKLKAIHWRIEKERTVLFFLKSMFTIIKENIAKYSSGKVLSSFSELFYYIDDDNGSKPYRKMISRFISVMNSKTQRAEQFDTNSISKLKDILKEAISLQEEVEKYFDLAFRK